MQDYEEIRRSFVAGEIQRHIAKRWGFPGIQLKIL